MSDKPEKIYAYPGSLIYSLKPAEITVEYIRADKANEMIECQKSIIEQYQLDLANPSEWISADGKPKNERVVLIHINDLAEFGVVAAWWCPEDYKWIALDDLAQFDEEKVDWWREPIKLPSPPEI